MCKLVGVTLEENWDRIILHLKKNNPIQYVFGFGT